MYKTAMVFHPESFIGFNKTQLIERHFLSAGIIGSRFRASSAYTAGTAYRQFIPKLETVQRYHYGIIRIHIQATGQWLSGERALLVERTNLVVVEGDAFIGSKVQCSKLSDFLANITGDIYTMDCVPEVSCLGVRESHMAYLTGKHVVKVS